MSSESKSIQIFQHQQFGEIRSIINEDGEPWFVAKDVAESLGYKRTADAIREHCKGVGEMETPTSGGFQKMKIIPESDLYRLIMRSKLPQAEAFQDWVVEDVLPAIRKKGYYGLPQLDELIQQAKTGAIRSYNDLTKELKDIGTDVPSFIRKHSGVIRVIMEDEQNDHTAGQNEQTYSDTLNQSKGHSVQTNLSSAQETTYQLEPGSLWTTSGLALLTKKLGANEAIILSQLQRMIAEEKRNYILITHKDWVEKNPYKSAATLKRTLNKLEQKGLICSEKQFNAFVHTKSYSINYEVIEELLASPDTSSGGASC